MLTVDLVRFRQSGKTIAPKLIDPEDDALRVKAKVLIDLFQAHLERKVGELNALIDSHIGTSPDYLFQRGLVKLLFDRSEVAGVGDVDPVDLRKAIFKAASAAWPVVGAKRRDVISDVGQTFGLTEQAVEESMYGDLKEQLRLMAFEEMAPDALLNRYNLAQAQAILLKAREVTITLPKLPAKEVRALVRIMKFRRLMVRVRRTKQDTTLTLDGPASLFRHTTRYGLQLALFLPALAHLSAWRLEAQVVWGKNRDELVMTLSEADGLRSHTRLTGVWLGEEERHFEASWKKLKTPWKLGRNATLVDLGGEDLLVPDYRFTHPDGRVGLLDIVWHWRARNFERKLDLIRSKGPSHLIVALASRLQVDESDSSDTHTRVVGFKGVIQPKKILAMLEGLDPVSS